ncbi:hypothetical protein TNCV_2545451 [Trichonephila clavipes]|nr:hypothetical protein TNCV_2545451 [Trichonephila clavipes]
MRVKYIKFVTADIHAGVVIEDQHKRAKWEQSGVWLRKWEKKRTDEMKKQQEILAQDHLQERRKLLAHLLYHENQMFEKELLQMGYVILKK